MMTVPACFECGSGDRVLPCTDPNRHGYADGAPRCNWCRLEARRLLVALARRDRRLSR